MSKLLGVKVSAEEHAIVLAKARAAGCHSISTYMRQRLLEDNTDTVLEILQTLERRSLEQLARTILPEQVSVFEGREKRSPTKEEKDKLLGRIKAKLVEKEAEHEA